MIDKIFLIDDNPDLLFNLKLLFELNGFEVYTAIDGFDAFTKLHNEKIEPSLIVCDIMMPRMDGYEFFKAISNDPDHNSIPFIFLTAKSSSEDVRFGKLLGIDDYLTKPFAEEDLLSIVKGKIEKRKKIDEVNKKFNLGTFTGNLLTKKMDSIDYQQSVIFLVLWDELVGPKLISSFSNNNSIEKNSLEKIGVQLFQSSVSIFGFQDDLSRESLLLTIKNIGKKGFVLFDSYDDLEVRGDKRLFMLGIINYEISYFDSLVIEKKFSYFAENFKIHKTIDLKEIYFDLFKDNKLIFEEIG